MTDIEQKKTPVTTFEALSWMERRDFLRGAKQLVADYYHLSPDSPELTLKGEEGFYEVWETCFGKNGYLKGESSQVDQWKTMISTAYVLTEYAHQYQHREEKDPTTEEKYPYIIHPNAVALSVAKKHHAEGWIVADSYMHDILEDSQDNIDQETHHSHEVTKEDIVALFSPICGNQIVQRNLIPTLRALKEVKAKQKQQEFVKTHEKVISESLKNPAVLLIKLEDRLNNLRTIGAMPEEKQDRKAEETLLVYVPLAEQFGFHEEAVEMAELSLRTLDRLRAGGVNTERIETIRTQLETVHYDRLEHLIKETLGNYNEFLHVTVSAPTFEELYTAISDYPPNNDKSPADWEFPDDEVFLNATIVISDETFEQVQGSDRTDIDLLEARVLSYLRPHLRILLDPEITTFNAGDFIGIAPLIADIRMEKDGGGSYFLARLQNGTKMRVRVIPKKVDTIEQFKLSQLLSHDYLTNVQFSDDVHDIFSIYEEKRRQLTDLYTKSMSDNNTPEDMYSFSRSLRGSFLMHVIEINEDKESIQLETTVSNQSTIMDFLLRYKRWQYVQQVEINGEVFTDFSRTLSPQDKISILFAKHTSEAMSPQIAWLSALKTAKHRRSDIYNAILSRYKLLKRSKHPDLVEYEKEIRNYGWSRIRAGLRHDPKFYRFSRVFPLLPERLQPFHGDKFIFNVGCGQYKEEDIRDVRKAMEIFWNSLDYLKIYAIDRPELLLESLDMLSRLQKERNDGKKMDVVGFTSEFLNGSNSTTTRIYFAPSGTDRDFVEKAIKALQDTTKGSVEHKTNLG